MTDPATTASMFKYPAFISYSHRDKAWGDWLHKGLERYKVPKPLVGRATSRGETVPARIFPVFRDREELPTAVDLGEIINAALEQSRYLIVICSPASARSQWVNQEIIQFKRLGGENRVLAIIVEGEPNAGTGKPGFTAEQECFPEALRYKLGPDGYLSTQATEPIAADARPHADGKANALLKLVAGVLGVNYDDLKRRDEIQRRQQRRVAAATAGTIALAIAGLSATAWMQRNEAVGHRMRADENALEARRKNEEAIARGKTAGYHLAEAELGQARKSLADRDAVRAIQHCLRAIDGAESVGRELEAAWQVLRRAVDLQSSDAGWQAHRESINSMFFNSAGDRLLTSCKALGEVIVWSAGNGRALTTIPCESVELAAWTDQKDEIVTVRVSDPGSGFAFSSGSRSELAWWNAETGTMTRKQEIPGTVDHPSAKYGAENPRWISLGEWVGNKFTSRMIRLDDGFSDQSISIPARIEFVPSADVALTVGTNDGVRVFSLRNGREESRLAGIGPTEMISLSSVVPSVDGSAVACVISSNEIPVAAGVWRLADGARLAEYPPGDLAENGWWLLAASGNRLLGPPSPELEKFAAALGMTSMPFSSNERLVAWSDDNPDAGPAAAAVHDFGRIVDPKITLRYPAMNMEREIAGIDEQATHLAYAPLTRSLALAGKAGNIKLLRLVHPPLHHEAGLPEKVNLVATANGSNHVLLRTGEKELVTWDLAARGVVATMRGVAAGKLENTVYFPATTTLWNAGEAWVAVIPPRPDGDTEPAVATFHDTRTGTMLGEYPLKDFNGKILLAPRGRRAIVPLPERKWELLAVDDGKLNVIPLMAEPLEGHEWSVNPAFSPDGEKVFLSPGPGWLQEFSTSTGLPRAPFKFADNQGWSNVSMICVHPSGSHALLGTMESAWKVDLATRAVTSIGYRSRVGFFGEGEIVGYEEGNRTHWARWPEMIRMADIHGSFDLGSSGALGNTGDLVWVKEGFLSSLVVASADDGAVRMNLEQVIGVNVGSGLAAVDAGGVRIVRLHDGEILAEVPDLRASQACFSADGSRVGLVLMDSERFVSLPLTIDREELRARAKQLVR